MTTGRINQVAAEIFFETERSANTGDSESRNYFVQARLEFFLKMRPRMSFALVIFCITLPGGVCVQRNFIFSCWTPPPVGFAAPASFLEFLIYQRGPSAHRPTCGGLCEDPELSVRTVWFDMN